MPAAPKVYRDNPTMRELLPKGPPVIVPQPGEVVEGTVIFKGKNKLLIDVGGVATGIVSGRELRDSFLTFQELTIGSPVTAMVLEDENDEGMIVMSLRRVSQRKAWDRFRKLTQEEGTMPFVPQEANKGGLLASVDGIRTFLPVSQLAPVNYPRVTNADPGEIITRLQKFVGHPFTVKIIAMDEDAGKIVVSEREAIAEQRAKALESIRVGDEKDGTVSGVVNFGIFVTFEGLEGLVHISEIAWGHVKNPAEHVKTGDRVRVKVIGVEGEKLSLSIKRLQKDPWEEVAERYPVGKKVKGTVMRLADYGAFVKLEPDINGLVHLSEIAHHKVADAGEALRIGQKVDVQVINIDPDERRIGLSIKALLPINKEEIERLKREREEAEGKVSKVDKVDKVVETPDLSGDLSTEAPAKGEALPAGRSPDEGWARTEKASPAAQFIASKTGKKYYPANSAAAKRIKGENRVEFASEAEAEKAGYSA